MYDVIYEKTTIVSGDDLAYKSTKASAKTQSHKGAHVDIRQLTIRLLGYDWDLTRFQSEMYFLWIAGLVLGLQPANKRRRYKVTPPAIGWAQT